MPGTMLQALHIYFILKITVYVIYLYFYFVDEET